MKTLNMILLLKLWYPLLIDFEELKEGLTLVKSLELFLKSTVWAINRFVLNVLF